MSATSTVVPCPVCGALERSDDPLGGRLARCGACRFAWTIATIDAPEALYDDEYYDEGGYDGYLVPSARRFEAARRLRWLLGHERPSTLLEAGCAAGFFVEAAVAAGISATGIEVSEAMATYARDELGLAVRHGRFEAHDHDADVDAVCAFHVLEHVEEPRAFLDAARRALRPGGLLALEVPNIESPAARRGGLAWRGLQPEYHRWHFGPRSLERIVADAGFRVEHVDTLVFRYYQPPRYRRRAGRGQIPTDVRNLRSVRLTHPSRGDLLRLVARRPADPESGGAP